MRRWTACASSAWVELGELVETSYRQVALKRQLVALDRLRPNLAPEAPE
jgi:hypothetical protein